MGSYYVTNLGDKQSFGKKSSMFGILYVILLNENRSKSIFTHNYTYLVVNPTEIYLWISVNWILV